MPPTSTRFAERASESLFEDEKLRSNLTDAQANLLLTWASDWLTAQISAAQDDASAQRIAQNKGQAVRKVVATLNGLAQKGAFTTAQGMALLDPLLKKDKSLSRQDLSALLDKMTNAT